MKYTLSTNFDNKLIEEIAPLGTIESVYGKFNADIVGGGRISFLMPQISFKKLKDHIRCCHNHGIKFNYLLNARCLSGREFTKKYRRIFHFIDKIVNAGVDIVTIANMGFLYMIKARYPELEVASSMYNDTRSVSDVQKMIEAGVSEITLSPQVNRNFPLLREMVKQTKQGITLRLLGNIFCVFHCMTIQEHALLNAHRSQIKGGIAPDYAVDPFLLSCGLSKIENPVKMISSRWIRPEDVELYDEIGKGRLIIKLVERAAPTDWLIKTARAYSEKKKEGNLAELLFVTGMPAQIDKRALVRGFLKGNLSPRTMGRVINALKQIPYYIDNSKLEGFLEGMKEFDCEKRNCDDQGWGEGKEGCHYCRNWAKKAINIDKNEQEAYVKETRQLLKEFFGGKLF